MKQFSAEFSETVAGHRKRLLIISPGIPHVSDGASVVLFYHYIEGLKTAGFDILNVLLLQPDNSNEKQLSEYVSKIVEPGAFEVVLCRRERFLKVGLLSIDIDRSVLDEIQRVAQTFRPDTTLCFDLLSAWAASALDHGRKAVWLGDLNFQTHLYHGWYSTRENPINAVGLPLIWWHSVLWRNIYRDVLANVDRVIVSSNSSVRELDRLGIRAQYEPYPWPNTLPGFLTAQKSPKPTFLFFGTLSALGSRSAFHFMIHSLYPELVKKWGRNGFEIRITGSRSLPEWIAKWLKDKPEFRYLGFVEDIDSVMASSYAVLVPIDVPVGSRSRILTAMAKGILVIAHRNAALGNPDLVDGDTCYLAANTLEFVDRMQRAVSQPEETRVIVERARSLYNSRFRPDVATKKMSELMLSISEDTK